MRQLVSDLRDKNTQGIYTSKEASKEGMELVEGAGTHKLKQEHGHPLKGSLKQTHNLRTINLTKVSKIKV